MSPLKGAGEIREPEAILPLVFGFMLFDVLTNRGLISSHGRYEMPACPEMVPNIVALMPVRTTHLNRGDWNETQQVSVKLPIGARLV